MRTYQIHPTALAGCCDLMPAYGDLSIDRPISSQRTAVPCSPGRARRLYPDPSSRRRRQ